MNRACDRGAGQSESAANSGGPRSPREAIAAVCAVVGSHSQHTHAAERVPLASVRGRVLAEALLADRDSPAIDVSAMDGFAVRIADLTRPDLPIARADAMIGRAPVAMEPGAVTRIVTGAPISPGADAVVRREDLEERDGRIKLTIPRDAVKPGMNIRRRAENARAGAAVVASGRVIDAPTVGAAAGFGLTDVAVFPRVRVAIITTGDEVRGPGEPCEPWQLRDSNGPSLHAMLAARPWIDAAAPRRAIDQPEAISAELRDAINRADAVLLTGGVSMGDRDFVPRVVRDLGARTVFHKLPQRPGRPMLAAVMPSGVPVLGLPGNPVSVLVTARRIGVPILAHLAGIARFPSDGRQRHIAPPDGATTDLWWHRVARERPDGGLELIPLRGSGDLAAAAASSGFVELPPGATGAGPWGYFSWDTD